MKKNKIYVFCFAIPVLIVISNFIFANKKMDPIDCSNYCVKQVDQVCSGIISVLTENEEYDINYNCFNSSKIVKNEKHD